MCARIFLPVTDEELAAFLELADLPPLAPRYNIAPGQDVLVVHADAIRGRRGRLLRWGLLAGRGPSPASGRPLVNVRSENALRGAFRTSLRDRRCIVPAAGFFEWKKVGKASQPYAVRSRAGLIGLGGLWAPASPERPGLDTFTILTTEPNERIAQVHDRMPVVLERDQFAAWLDPKTTDASALEPLMRSYPAERMLLEPVSPRVNRATVDDPACLEPAAPVLPDPRLF
jgi:putative SOS response-associated peptidase YedK